jgi:hypothetical protein
MEKFKDGQDVLSRMDDEQRSRVEHTEAPARNN